MTTRRSRQILALICVVAVACRAPLLWGDFIDFDDSILIYENRVITHLTWPHVWEVLTTNFRGENQNPMHLANMVNFSVGRGAYWTFALANLAWFSATIAVVYGFARLFLTDRRWALLAAAIFALHSTNVDGLGWMSARCHLMGVPFALGAFVLWHRYLLASDRWRWIWFVAANIAVGVALWNKMIFVGVIPGLLAYEVFIRRRVDRWLFVDKLPLAVVLLGFASTPLQAQGRAISGEQLATSFWTRIGLVVEYLVSAVVPRPTFLAAWFTATTGPFEPGHGLITSALPPVFNLAVLVVFSGLLLWLWQAGIRAPLFLGGLAVLVLAPSMGVRPGSPDVAFAFRYMWVPTACFGVGVASLLSEFWDRLSRLPRAGIVAVVSLVLVAHMIQSVQQAAVWRSPEAQYAQCVVHFPISTVCHQRLADLAELEGRPDQALAYLLEIERVRTQYSFRRSVRSADSLSRMYAERGDLELALFFAERALVRDALSVQDRRALKVRRQELQRSSRPR